MKYRLFLITATAVVLGSTLSCSQNEVVTNDGDQKDPISFNVNVGTLPAPDVTTRGYTTTSAETGYTFSGGEYMTVGLTHPSGSEVIKQYSVGAGSSGNNALTYQKESDGTTTGYTFDWLSTSETVTIRAWSDGKTTTAAPAVDPDGQPFTVETTQTGDVKELLYSPATSYAYTTSAINIPLYHQLARIVVTIVRANTSTPISSVTIGHNSTGNRVPIIGTFAKPTGTGVNYGTWSVTSEATQSTHWGVITPKEETAGSVYSAVVIPGGATEYPANTRLFNITIGSEVFAYKIPTGGLTLEAGKQYNYTITVENEGITVTSNITDWDPADDYTHGDGLALTKNIKMNPLWWVAEYNMTNAPNAATLTMATTDDAGYYYSWTDAMSTFAASTTGYDGYKKGNKTISGQSGTWHLPTSSEWSSIIYSMPNQNGPFNYTFDDEANVYNPVPTTVANWGYNYETKTTGVEDVAFFHKYSDSEIHAIRFLGTSYCSAWKYVIANNRLSIYATMIDPVVDDGTGLAAKIYYNYKWSSITWGNDVSKGAVMRNFYFCGHAGSSAASYAGNHNLAGFYQGTTDLTTSWHMICGSSPNRFSHRSHDKITAYSVRLFRDN